jgi:hypothetical protein
MVVDIRNKPETAQIVVEGADQENNTITIENTLTDESARKVSLNPGAKVAVTIRADAEGTRPIEPNVAVLKPVQ